MPDALILATGSKPVETVIEGREGGNVIEAGDLLAGRAKSGARVVVADWRCDWIGIGVAMLLQRTGHHVRLAVNGIAAGQNLQRYVRDLWAGRLHEAGIEVITYARPFGIDGESAYFLHGASGRPIVVEGVDTLVLCSGHAPDVTLERELVGGGLPLTTIGDCTIARSAEEAIYDGLVLVRSFLGTLDSR